MDVSLASSFLFLTTAYYAFVKQKLFYGCAFLLLMTSSVLIRFLDEDSFEALYVIDRVYIAVVILTGLSYFVQLPFLAKLVPFLFFLTVCILYAIGYWFSCFSFDTDIPKSQRHQALIHCLSILGHHSILWHLA